MTLNRRYALTLSLIAAITVISPLIVFSVPILVLLGPSAVILLRNSTSRTGHVWSAWFSIAAFVGLLGGTVWLIAANGVYAELAFFLTCLLAMVPWVAAASKILRTRPQTAADGQFR
jgi:hypothetical protein